MKEDFEWHIASNPAYVPPLVREILNILRGEYGELTKEEHNDIKVILSELIFNAVLHGNKANEQKRVRVTMAAAGKNIRVSITDEGSGFNMEETLLRELNREEFSEGGRGIVLVKGLADDVVYSDEGRKVTFEKRIHALGEYALTGGLYGSR